MNKYKPEKIEIDETPLDQRIIRPPVSEILLRSAVIDQTRSQLSQNSQIDTSNQVELSERELESLKKKQLFKEFCAEQKPAAELLQTRKYSPIAPCFKLNLDGQIIRLNSFIEQSDDEMIEAMANSAHFSQLRRIHLNDGQITDKAIAILCDSGLLKKVKSIRLICTGVTEEGLKTLFDCPDLGRLRSFEFMGSNLNKAGVQAICQSKHVTRLKQLNLNETYVDRDCVEQLFRSENLRQLESLELGLTDCDDQCLEVLASETMPRLKELILDFTNISDVGLQYLQQSDSLRRIEHLSLAGTRLTGHAIVLLGQMKLSKLVRLDVSRNIISNHALAAAKSWNNMPELEDLDLSEIDVDQEVIKEIIYNPALPKLQTICYGSGECIDLTNETLAN